MGARGWGEGQWRVNVRYRVSVGKDGKVLEMDGGGDSTIM